VECFTHRGDVILRKRAYSTKKRAKAALYRTARRYGRSVADYNVYKCRYCRQYHFGRKSRAKAGNGHG
jgi:hypothetical protein